MEIVMLIAVPLITSLLAPAALEIIRKNINKRKEEAESRISNFAVELEADKHNDQVAAELRRELREENRILKERNSSLESVAANATALANENAHWKKRFYEVKKEKQNLEFELSLVKQELEEFRRQYERYSEVRAKAERQVRESDDGRPRE